MTTATQVRYYRVTRFDSNADGASRHHEIVMGTVAAADFETANRFARDKWDCNRCQWLELDNVARLSAKARTRAMSDRIYSTEE